VIIINKDFLKVLIAYFDDIRCLYKEQQFPTYLKLLKYTIIFYTHNKIFNAMFTAAINSNYCITKSKIKSVF